MSRKYRSKPQGIPPALVPYLSRMKEPSTLHLWGEWALDPATGLPALPPGFLWRVSRSAENRLKVSLIHVTEREVPAAVWGTKWVLYDHEVAWTTLATFGSASALKPRLLEQCEYVMMTVANAHRAKIAAANSITPESLIGDYPPKSIRG